jgi:Protein of unknown function (DUF3137)
MGCHRRIAAMAAVLSRARAGQAERRLPKLFQREVAPHLAALERRRRQHHLAYIGALAGMLAGIFAAFLLAQSLQHALSAGAILLVVGFLAMQGVERSYCNQVRKVVMPAICGAIGDLSHGVGAAPDLDLDHLAQVGLVPGHNRERVDDVFRGRHRGTGFTMAEVRLRRVGRGSRRSSRTVFRGLIFAIEVPRAVPARILIARDGGLIGNGLKGWIKDFSGMRPVTLADAAFEARFEVYADRAEVALATVTPELCANLVALAAAQDGAPFQAAFADGRFFVAMRRRGDPFRIGSVFRSTDLLEEEAARLLEEVQIVHRLIDYLHGDRPPLEPAADPTRPEAQGPVVRR